jgi:hypothetical protein
MKAIYLPHEAYPQDADNIPDAAGFSQLNCILFLLVVQLDFLIEIISI